MNKQITINSIVFLVLLACTKALFGQISYEQTNIPLNIVPTHSIVLDSTSNLVYAPARDGKRLLINTGVNAAMSLAKFGILWFSPESFSNWDKDEVREKGWGQSWKDNVKAGPVKDEDGFLLNGVMHPWGGAIYYMSARGSGYRWWESFIYSSLLSTFMWEYGIEAFMEVPSWQDLILTPTIGSAMGECFFLAKGQIVRNNKRVLNSRFLGVTSLILLDPVNEITDVLGYKTKHKVQVNSAFLPTPIPGNSTNTAMTLQVRLSF